MKSCLTITIRALVCEDLNGARARQDVATFAHGLTFDFILDPHDGYVSLKRHGPLQDGRDKTVRTRISSTRRKAAIGSYASDQESQTKTDGSHPSALNGTEWLEFVPESTPPSARKATEGSQACSKYARC